MDHFGTGCGEGPPRIFACNKKGPEQCPVLVGLRKTLQIDLATNHTHCSEQSAAQQYQRAGLWHCGAAVHEIGAEIRHRVAGGVGWVGQRSSSDELVLNERDV